MCDGSDADALLPDPRLLATPGEHLADPGFSKRTTLAKPIGLVFGVPMLDPDPLVSVEVARCLATNREVSRPTALAQDAEHSLIEVNVVRCEPGDLGKPRPGVEENPHGFREITPSPRMNRPCTVRREPISVSLSTSTG